MTEAHTCRVCGKRFTGCGYVSRETCSKLCYGIKSKFKREESHRRSVTKVWEFWNRDRPIDEGFMVSYLQDYRGRWRAWWEFNYLADLRETYRIDERLDALREKRRQGDPGESAEDAMRKPIQSVLGSGVSIQGELA